MSNTQDTCVNRQSLTERCLLVELYVCLGALRLWKFLWCLIFLLCLMDCKHVFLHLCTEKAWCHRTLPHMKSFRWLPYHYKIFASNVSSKILPQWRGLWHTELNVLRHGSYLWIGDSYMLHGIQFLIMALVQCLNPP